MEGVICSMSMAQAFQAFRVAPKGTWVVGDHMAGPQKAAQAASCVKPKLVWCDSNAVKDITSDGMTTKCFLQIGTWKSFTKYYQVKTSNRMPKNCFSLE